MERTFHVHQNFLFLVKHDNGEQSNKYIRLCIYYLSFHMHKALLCLHAFLSLSHIELWSDFWNRNIVKSQSEEQYKHKQYTQTHTISYCEEQNEWYCVFISDIVCHLLWSSIKMNACVCMTAVLTDFSLTLAFIYLCVLVIDIVWLAFCFNFTFPNTRIYEEKYRFCLKPTFFRK